MTTSFLPASPRGRALLGLASALGIALGTVAAAPAHAAGAPTPVLAPGADGVLTLDSAYGFDETIARLRADVGAKGIRFFDAIDQAALGREAKLPIRRSTLILFGNPPLGVQFLEANPLAGLDWPVRMLVTERADGGVSVAWTDFDWIARRYRISTRDAQFKMARDVAASIAGSVATR